MGNPTFVVRLLGALLVLAVLSSSTTAQEALRPAAGPAPETRRDITGRASRPLLPTPSVGGARTLQVDLEVFGGAPEQLVYSPAMFVIEVLDGPFTASPTSAGGPVDAYSLDGPPLPAGLVLDPLSGVLSGRPQVLQVPTMHTITASNEAGSTSFDFLIEVTLPPPPGDLDYGDAPEGRYRFTDAAITPLVPTIAGRVDSYSVSPPLPNALLNVSGGLTLPRTGVLLPENVTPLAFPPPEQTITHPWESLNVWLPNGTPPETGWPVLLSNPNAGYYGAPPFDQLDPADPIQLFHHMAVNAGFAVVFAGIIDSGPVTGWFAPPGHASGRWENPDGLMPEKDLLHALQWVKEQAYYDLDTNRIFLHGVSAGATLAAWVGLGGELATGASAQSSRSSRVAGVLCFDTLMSFPAYAGDNTVLAHHWESVTSPGSSATRMDDADPEVLDANSVARVLLDPVCNGATTPVFLAYECDSGSIDYSNDADQFPALRNRLGANVHDLWHGAKLWERLLFLNDPFHRARSELFIGNGVESQLGSMLGAATGTYTGTVLDSPGLYDAAIDWMVLRSLETIPDPAGLQLHPKSGVVHGTPNLSAPPTGYAITARNPGGATTEVLPIQVKISGGGRP